MGNAHADDPKRRGAQPVGPEQNRTTATIITQSKTNTVASASK